VFSARGYDLVDTDDHLSSFWVAAGTSFALRRWQFDVEGAFSAGGTDTVAHQQVPSSLALTGFEVGGTARLIALTWLHPYLRVGVGYDWATLELFSETRLTQTVGNSASPSDLLFLDSLIASKKYKKSNKFSYLIPSENTSSFPPVF